MPVSVTSTANSDPYAMFGPSGFNSSPVYNKPAIDLSNPLHLAVMAGAVVLFLYLRKKF